MLPVKSEKSESTERIKLQNQECIRTLGNKENYKRFGKLETDTIKQTEMKGK